MTAQMHLDDQDGALLMLQAAVGTSQIGRTVIVTGKDGKAEQRVVQLSYSYDDIIVVTAGLKAGNQVIARQLHKLRPSALLRAEAEMLKWPSFAGHLCGSSKFRVSGRVYRIDRRLRSKGKRRSTGCNVRPYVMCSHRQIFRQNGCRCTKHCLPAYT